MDIVTQSLLGAAVAQSGARRTDLRLATLVGLVAGVIADADVLIRSSTDPLLSLEYHRHFTHSIFFIPFGAAVAFILLWPFLRSRLPAGYLYVYCLLGYLLSGFIDACTSYGTHLLWPLSDQRVSWNIISIVDPVFTGLLLIGVVAGCWRGMRRFSQAALLIAGSYLLLASAQWQRAEDAAYQLAGQRGHHVERMVVKPTFGNILLWRSVYLSGDRFYIDVVRSGLAMRLYPGTSVPRLMPDEAVTENEKSSLWYRDILRFEYFSDGYLIQYPGKPEILGDVRYSMNPLSAEPLWGIRVDRGQRDRHAVFESYRIVTPQALSLIHI